MGLANTPAEIDLESATRQARKLYDDAAASRINGLATAIRKELAQMQNEDRARKCRAMAVAGVCGVLHTEEFGKGLASLLPEHLR